MVLHEILQIVAFVKIGGQIHETNFGEAEIGQLNVAERSDEQIVWLKVSMNDAIVMQIFDCQCGLGEIGPGHFFTSHVQWQWAHVLDQSSYVTALYVTALHTPSPCANGSWSRTNR